MSEKHDEATAKLMSYEELLAAKNDELSRIKKELGQAKATLAERTSESETIAILRAQVNLDQNILKCIKKISLCVYHVYHFLYS